MSKKSENTLKNLDLIFSNFIDPSKFNIIDQEFDGACFYNSISTHLIADYYSNTSIICNLENRNDKNELISIIKVISDTEDESGIDYESERLNKFSRKIQQMCVDYLCQHQDDYCDQFDMIIKDLIISTHELGSMKEYSELYSNYAGADGDLDDLDDRWGGEPEQYAISELFKVNILIYTPKCIKRDKLISGTIRYNSKEKIYKPLKNVRYSLLQNLGNYGVQINLLWRKTQFGEHFDLLRIL